MASTFPSILTTYTTPLATDRLNSPSHSGIEGNQNSGLVQVEAVIGIEGASSVVGSMQYLIKSPASDGGGHVQSANKGGTGQTTYTKGDILIAQSSSVLTKVAASATDGYALVTDSTQATGVKWGVPNSQPTIRFFNTATLATTSILTWTKPSVLSYILVQAIGGGGGGGKGVIAGGDGAAGQDTYFGSVLTAKAGSPGAQQVGGAGGTSGTGGSININGQTGYTGWTAGSGVQADGAKGGVSGFGGPGGYGGRGATVTTDASGGGGGGGEFRAIVIPASNLGANVAVGIGGGGTSGLSANNGAAGSITIYEY